MGMAAFFRGLSDKEAQVLTDQKQVCWVEKKIKDATSPIKQHRPPPPPNSEPKPDQKL